SGKSNLARAGDGGDHPGLSIHLADAMVTFIGNEQIAGGVDGQTWWKMKPSRRSRPAIPGISGLAIAGYGGDDPGLGIHLADAIVTGIGKEEIAGGVDSQTWWKTKPSRRGRPAIPGISGLAIAGYGGDDPGLGIHLADAIVTGIGKEEIAGGVDGQTSWIIKLSRRGRPAISGISTLAIAGYGGDDPGLGIHLADAIVTSIGNEKVAGGVDGHSS